MGLEPGSVAGGHYRRHLGRSNVRRSRRSYVSCQPSRCFQLWSDLWNSGFDLADASRSHSLLVAEVHHAQKDPRTSANRKSRSRWSLGSHFGANFRSYLQWVSRELRHARFGPPHLLHRKVLNQARSGALRPIPEGSIRNRPELCHQTAPDLHSALQFPSNAEVIQVDVPQLTRGCLQVALGIHEWLLSPSSGTPSTPIESHLPHRRLQQQSDRRMPHRQWAETEEGWSGRRGPQSGELPDPTAWLLTASADVNGPKEARPSTPLPAGLRELVRDDWQGASLLVDHGTAPPLLRRGRRRATPTPARPSARPHR
jgi:hypothetical protein